MGGFVERNFLDEDLTCAARRYAQSHEFSRVLSTLRPHLRPGARLLDLGAGRGLTSLALAEAGLNVTSIEYDPSDVVGVGAQMELDRGPRWTAIRGDALQLPFRSSSFEVAFCRSLLHHLSDLDQGLAEIWRILEPGGVFLACNEHVLALFSNGEKFLRAHPAVAFGVDENAYYTLTYWWKFRRSGFRRIHFYGYPLDFNEFVEATRCNPFRARLTHLPLAGYAFAQILHRIHVCVRRYLLVPEETLPAISIVAVKSKSRGRGQPHASA